MGEMVLGGILGVDRLALLAALIPTKTGNPVFLLDVGANAECKPIHLAQFAVMGEAYVRVALGTQKPSVGLMSICEEGVKENDLIKEALPLPKQIKSINFVGNVERRNVFMGKVDVIVTDSFYGQCDVEIVCEGVDRSDVREFVTRNAAQRIELGVAETGLSEIKSFESCH